MIADFDAWAAPRLETNNLSELADTTIAIDATWYLDRLLYTPPTKEPLLSALAGLPFALREHVVTELDKFQKLNITPRFVFHGLAVGKKFRPFEATDEAAKLNSQAWDFYNQRESERAVETFGLAHYVVPEDLYGYLKQILYSRGVDYVVAPYSAWAQLSYMTNGGPDLCDSIAGPSELLLYDVTKVITDLDFDKEEFTWVERKKCMEELGLSSSEQFVDVTLLAGTDLLPALPTLRRSGPPRTREIIQMMRMNNENGIGLCARAQVDDSLKRIDYADRYRRTRLVVKHHIVLKKDGLVAPFNGDSAPNDLHELIGARLSEELYYYFSTGVIGPRPLNQLTQREILEKVPFDGGEAEDYRALVTTKLNPIRLPALSLLAAPQHRGLQYSAIKVRTWFASDNVPEYKLTDFATPEPVRTSWNVHDELINTVNKKQTGHDNLLFALESLQNADFARQTITRRNPSKLLKSTQELTLNTLWRFLTLRGYIDAATHTLTPWGRSLLSTLQALPLSTPTSHATPLTPDTAILAIELLRLDLLTTSVIFPYPGESFSAERSDLLISRLACLGALTHESIGYTGPLSRSLLGYAAMIEAVRRTLRDAIECCFAFMLLNGDVDRANLPPSTSSTSTSTPTPNTDTPAIDLRGIALHLPFLLPQSCALGIAMKHYLDDIAVAVAATSASDTNGAASSPSKDKDKATKSKEKSSGAGGALVTEEMKAQARLNGRTLLFPHSRALEEDVAKGFAVWDAVYAGVREGVAGGVVGTPEGKKWEDIDAWVGERR